MRRFLLFLPLFIGCYSGISNVRCSDDIDTLVFKSVNAEISLKDRCFYVIIDTSASIEKLRVEVGEVVVYGKVKGKTDIGVGKLTNYGELSDVNIGIGEFKNLGSAGEVDLGIGSLRNFGNVKGRISLGIGEVVNEGDIDGDISIGIGKFENKGNVRGNVKINLGNEYDYSD